MADNGDKGPTPAERRAFLFTGTLLRGMPRGNAAMLIVHAPLIPVPGQEGAAGFDLSNLMVLSPDDLPKLMVTQLEAAIESWAETTRRRLNAGRIIQA